MDQLWLVMIPPDDADIAALDSITVFFATLVIPIFGCKCPISEMPEHIIRSNCCIDVVDQMLVHHADRFMRHTVFTGRVTFPVPIVPLAAVLQQSGFVFIGYKGAIAVFDDITVTEVP